MSYQPQSSTTRAIPQQTAGLVDLANEIAATPTPQLVEVATLLIELPSTMQAVAWPRLRLTLWELQRRAEAGEMAGAA